MIDCDIIAIVDSAESAQIAARARRSAFWIGGIQARITPAITPTSDPIRIMDQGGLSTRWFLSQDYSEPLATMGAFLSHRALWLDTIRTNRPRIILEHDAVFRRRITPEKLRMLEALQADIVNLGAPSYGRFQRPPARGVQPMFSKSHLPGAHAYYVSPEGARELVNKSKGDGARPTDLFINIHTFPHLLEMFPWAVTVRERFSTLQYKKGSVAKRQFSKNYRFLPSGRDSG